MASWSAVRIGSAEYGGSQRYINDPQSQLFNAADLIAVGEVGQPDFERCYRINVRELRTRLEALGYTLAQVRDDIRNAAGKVSGKQMRSGDPRSRQFLKYLDQVTIEQLLNLVKDWSTKGSDSYLDALFPPSADDFSAALLEFVRGAMVDLLEADNIWIHGHHFERLLCEVYDEDEHFELDFANLVSAGYYRADDVPIGDRYDEVLSSLTPGGFRIGQVIDDEESETLEFKSVGGGNPCKSIASMVTRYVIGFLNRSGGRILFGVDDDGRVEGVKISRLDRDELQRRINAACIDIRPAVPLSEVHIWYRSVIGSGKLLDDLFVVQLDIPRGKPTEMYFRSNGETWLRIATETRELKGHELFVHICNQYSQADSLLKALSDRARIAAEEVVRLRIDGAQSQDVLARKQEEVSDLKRALRTVNTLIEGTDLLCPKCRAPMLRRETFPIMGYAGEREIDTDVEYVEYQCGYAVRGDEQAPISRCKHFEPDTK